MTAWPEVPLRRVFRVVNGGTPTGDATNWEGDVPWATPVDLGRVNGGVLTSTDRTLTEAGLLSGSRLVPVGALVVSTRAPIGYVTEAGVDVAFNQGCRGLVPITSIDSRYFRYQLSTMTSRLESRGQGSTFSELSSDGLASSMVVCPPCAVQRAIADFLDRETARIDALIARKRRLLRLLEERRWVSFDHAVARVAARFVPLRRALLSITDGPFGSAFTSSEYVDAGVAVIRLGNIGFAEWRGEELAYLPLSRFSEFSNHAVEEGDILIAALGDATNHAGRACVAPPLGPAIVKGKCLRARINPDVASADYLAMLLSSPLGAAATAAEARGSTRSMINLDIVKSVAFPMPHVTDQIEIAASVRREWLRTAHAVNRLTRQIDLLAERRQALITAAVTGELDVAESIAEVAS